MGLVAGSSAFGLSSCYSSNTAYNNARQRAENMQIAKQALTQRFGSESPLVSQGALRSSYNDYVFTFATPSDSARIDYELRAADARVNKALIEGRGTINKYATYTSQNPAGYDFLSVAYRGFGKTVKKAMKERDKVLKSVLKDPCVVVSKAVK